MYALNGRNGSNSLSLAFSCSWMRSPRERESGSEEAEEVEDGLRVCQGVAFRVHLYVAVTDDDGHGCRVRTCDVDDDDDVDVDTAEGLPVESKMDADSWMPSRTMTRQGSHHYSFFVPSHNPPPLMAHQEE